MTESQLEQLYDDHAQGLFHYLCGFTRDEGEARDLLQEVFIKLARGTGENKRSEKAWVFRLAHNLAIDWLRRRQTRGRMKEMFSQEPEENFQPSVDPDLEVIAGRLDEAMRSLPDEQRTVLELRLREDMTFDEIAEAQGIPLNTAASRCRYGLEKLRPLLRPLYDEIK